MTSKEMQNKMREFQEKQQNDFIDSLVEKVELFIETVIKKDYEFTGHERVQFCKIAALVKQIDEWFFNPRF